MAGGAGRVSPAPHICRSAWLAVAALPIETLQSVLDRPTDRPALTPYQHHYHYHYHCATNRADALKGELDGFRSRERDLVARAALAQTDLDSVQGELKRVQVRCCVHIYVCALVEGVWVSQGYVIRYKADYSWL
jgi:hypothetical protein